MKAGAFEIPVALCDGEQYLSTRLCVTSCRYFATCRVTRRDSHGTGASEVQRNNVHASHQNGPENTTGLRCRLPPNEAVRGAGGTTRGLTTSSMRGLPQIEAGRGNSTCAFGLDGRLRRGHRIAIFIEVPGTRLRRRCRCITEETSDPRECWWQRRLGCIRPRVFSISQRSNHLKTLL